MAVLPATAPAAKPEAKPRVLVTRAPGQGSGLAEQLRALGADPILLPAIELAPPTSFDELDRALADFGSFHWLLFTSANAVQAFADRWQGRRAPDALTTAPDALTTARVHLPWRGSTCMGGKLLPEPQEERPPFQTPKIAAIGPATGQALEKIGLTVDLTPPQAEGESLASALLPHARQPDGKPRRFLLIRAQEAREHLPETLRTAGAEVTVAPAYRTVIPEASVARLQSLFLAADASPLVHAITFTSSSTARNLLALCAAAGVTLPETALRISIGPITTRTLVDLGWPAHAEAAEATVSALAQATMEALKKSGTLEGADWRT